MAACAGLPGAGAQTPHAATAFEFWNDHAFQPYRPEEQRALQAALLAQPRPADVPLPGGSYTVKNFNEVEKGTAIQVNRHTRFERPVRLQPPYHLPGAKGANLPTGDFHFEIEVKDPLGSGWRPFGPRLQAELKLLAQSNPPPAQALVAEEHGKACWLFGLDQLVSGDGTLVRVNQRRNTLENVRLSAGPAPSAGAGAAMRPGPASTARSASFNARPAVPASLLRSAVIVAHKASGRKGWGPAVAGAGEPVAADARAVLLESWRKEPRPASVTLPSGDIVEEFEKFEAGQARVHCTPATMGILGAFFGSAEALLELRFPEPAPGRVVLPDELDTDAGFKLSQCGKSLSSREVADLAAEGAEKRCLICHSDMEPNPGPAQSNHTAAAASTARGAARGGGGGSSGSSAGAMDSDGGNPSFGSGPAVEPPVFELQCGHAYHRECLEQWFQQRKRCPVCQRDFGKMLGKQPSQGTLHWHLEDFTLPGHDGSRQTIVIQFEFPSGVDEGGKPHGGRRPKGYLPCNAQGIVLLELFKIAFRRRVMFGLGTSMTCGEYRPTFNVHIKTSTQRGATGHGYPDDSYFQRSLDALRDNGVTLADLPA